MPPTTYQARPFAKFTDGAAFEPPKMNAEGDWIDPRDKLLPECASHCSSWLFEYNACVKRITQRVDGKGNCQGQYEEFAMCQDHCIAHEIFKFIK